MIQLPLEYQSGNTLLADLNPDYYITDKGRVVTKLTANGAWAKKVERIAPINFIELSDKKYKEVNEFYESFQAYLQEDIQKHGDHDQSSHGRRRVSGVPSNIDLDGKRFSQEAGMELANKARDYTNLRAETHDKLTQELLGKKWEDLPSYGDTKDEIPTPKGLEDSYGDRPGKVIPSQSTARGDDFWALVDADPAVVAARAEIDDSFLWQEMMNLESQSGGKMGDNPELVKDMLHKAQFFGNEFGQVEDVQNYLDGYKDGTTNLFVRNKKVDPTGVNLTSKQIVESSERQWQEYLSESTPTVLTSASVARQIVSQEKVKTLWETEKRPARAGRSDERYLDRRAMYENLAFGYDGNTAPEVRPVSGTLTNGSPYYEVLGIYGGKSAAAIDLKSSIRERTTFTGEDSLNGFENPQSLFSPKPITTVSRTGIKAALYGAATGRNYYKDYEFNFPEIQIHGGVRLEDIEGIRFFGEPSASVLATLNRKKVPYTIEGMPTNGSQFGQAD